MKMVSIPCQTGTFGNKKNNLKKKIRLTIINKMLELIRKDRIEKFALKYQISLSACVFAKCQSQKYSDPSNIFHSIFQRRRLLTFLHVIRGMTVLNYEIAYLCLRSSSLPHLFISTSADLIYLAHIFEALIFVIIILFDDGLFPSIVCCIVI